MAGYSQDSYEIEYYRIPSRNRVRVDHFAPSIQSLQAAQDIVRRYEKGRRAAAIRDRQSRRTVASAPSAVGVAGGDNVIQFRSPVWARPSSRLVYSRHYSQPTPLSPSSRARRTSLQRDARRLSYSARGSTALPLDALNPVAFDDVQSDMLARFGVMAIQALAVVLGLSGLFVLLTLL